jgi:sporulation protein YlmC with PRC-barrel domain
MQMVRTSALGATMVALGLAAEPAWSQAPEHNWVSAGLRNDLLRHILGMNVENQDGVKLGKVKNFVVDMPSGQVRYAVVVSGGLLGVRSHAKVVPAQALSLATAKKDTVALGVSRTRWSKAPGFKHSQLAELSDPDRMRQIHEFYGQQPPDSSSAPTGESAATTTATNPKGRKTRRAADTPERGSNLQLASELFGLAVFDRQRGKIGVVSDLLADLAGHKVTFAIVSTGGFPKRQERFAVPLRSLSLSASDQATIEADRTTFDQAQPLDQKVWRTASSAGAGGIYRFER